MQESEEQTEYINNYEEISIKELLLAVWKERKIICLVTAVVTAIALLYTFAIASPQYETAAELMIKNPSAVVTRYGTYEFPSENLGDYIQYVKSNDVAERVINKLQLNMTNTRFKNMITVNQEEASNRFTVEIKSNDADLAYEINRELINIYIDTIRVKFKTSAVDHFIKTYEVDIDNLKTNIKTEENLMKDTKELLDSIQPIFTLQKLLFSDPEAAAMYADEFNLDIGEISENVITQEYVNNNYFNVEAKYLENKMNLIAYSEELDRKQAFYEDLTAERDNINRQINTDEEPEILNGKVDVIGNNITVISEAEKPESPVSPNKMLNMALGLVLGLMLGVFAGLFKAYWENSI